MHGVCFVVFFVGNDDNRAALGEVGMLCLGTKKASGAVAFDYEGGVR